MTRVRVLGLAAAMTGCLVLGLFVGQPSAAQPQPAAPPSTAGRYQMVVSPKEYSTVFVCDTATGQCWYRTTHPEDKRWKDMGSPTEKPAK
jgi:hypothetical protein